MGKVILNALLLVMLIVSVGASWLLTPNPARPNLEFLPQMAHAPRYNAFSPNPNFTNGATLQRPEPGTIPRELMPLHFEATAQDALRAGEALQSPVAPENQRAHDRGAFVFANYCAVCHGAGGAGNGPVAQRGYPPPPSLLAEHAQNMKDGQLFHILSYGQNNMPSYASQLSREDRWNAILYVRSLQHAAAPASPGVAGTPVKADSQTQTSSPGGQP
ncbi:MAG TPA: cytochrome c [Terriglobales bacterium]|nr:cytochrome c [Terriglobales bacterium]